MNLINSTAITMTSREIAELVGSRHDSVKRTIERLSKPKVAGAQAAIGLPPLVEYLDGLGRPATEYVFAGEKGKRDSIVIVAQLSPEFTARLVDRWNELEAKVASVTCTVTAPAVAADHEVSRLILLRDSGLLTQQDANEAARRMVGLPPIAHVAAGIFVPEASGIRESAHGRELDLFGHPIPPDQRLVSGYDLSDMSGIPYAHMMSQMKRRGVYAAGERFPMPSGRSRKVLSAVGRKIAVQFQSGIVRWKPREALGFLGKPMPKDRLH